MLRFLANENFPREAVVAARDAGHDVAWVVERQPGIADELVLSIAKHEGQVLLTFDKDFRELVFRQGQSGSAGVILFRSRLRTPGAVSAFVLAVLAERDDWPGHFTVAQEDRLRVIRLP
jgi:predicted nuclease of predicted toxin-antitoxin system